MPHAAPERVNIPMPNFVSEPLLWGNGWNWVVVRRWCFLTKTQLIGAYGTQWVPCSFEVWVCSRIIMSLIWDQFSKDTREKLPKKYSLHQENIFCQRGQVHFSIDRWHCNKSFYQWISPLKYYKIHKIELQSFCYHIIY